MATILLGVTGSIAAYKAADLASRLSQGGHDVTVVMTAAARQLVSPNTFLGLTGNRVYVDLWDPAGQTEHIALTDRADLVVLAPATANTIAKLALGLADDMVSTTLLAVRCPVLVCPAMNTRMWESPPVQENLRRLAERPDVHLHEPGEGHLACGHVGAGRMAEPAAIAARGEELLAARAAAAAAPAGGAGPQPATAPPAPAGVAPTFLEIVSYDEAPAPADLEAERAHRAEARARGDLLATGPLGSPGSNRYGHLHRAPDLETAMARARQAPLARLNCRIEVFPWKVGDGLG